MPRASTIPPNHADVAPPTVLALHQTSSPPVVGADRKSPRAEEVDAPNMLNRLRQISASIRTLEAERLTLATTLYQQLHGAQPEGQLPALGTTSVAEILKLTGAPPEAAHACATLATSDSADPVSLIRRAVETGELSVIDAALVAKRIQPAQHSVAAPTVKRAVRELLRRTRGWTRRDILRAVDALIQQLVHSNSPEPRATASTHRFLRIGAQRDGLRSLRGLLDADSANVLLPALDRLMSPRANSAPSLQRGHVQPHTVAETTGAAEDGQVDPTCTVESRDELSTDQRTSDQRRLDCLLELVQRGAGARANGSQVVAEGGVRVELSLTDLRALADEKAPPMLRATFERDGSRVEAAQLRRMLCTAAIIPAVFGGVSEVLDVGRSERLFTPAQRRALAARDGGCRWPGCGRPPQWCEAHHLLPWSKGGVTDLDNGMLLCRFHHLTVHNHGWDIASDGPEFRLRRGHSISPAAQEPKWPVRGRIMRSHREIESTMRQLCTDVASHSDVSRGEDAALKSKSHIAQPASHAHRASLAHPASHAHPGNRAPHKRLNASSNDGLSASWMHDRAARGPVSDRIGYGVGARFWGAGDPHQAGAQPVGEIDDPGG